MAQANPLSVRFGEFELDEEDARLNRHGRPQALSPRSFALLCALARQPGRLVTKTALLDAVWGHQHVSESVLKNTISELRAVLGDDARQPRYVETAARRGYRFIGVIDGRPAAAQELGSSAAARTAQMDQGAAAPSPRTGLIGRRSQLAQLRAGWQRACGGTRQFFWITGDAGAGKSTLIDHLVDVVGARSCAHGQCVQQHGAGEPYLPVLEALAALTRDDSSLMPLLRIVAPTWLLHLPWLVDESEREALRREVAGSGQERMLREFGELLQRYSAERALLLVTEDLHWSDDATLRLIDHLARRRGGLRFMWLASFRVAEVSDGDHPLRSLRHELQLHRLAEEIVLEPFSEHEVAEYLGARLPGPAAAGPFVRPLHERTGGLPLFVAKVVDELEARGALQAPPIAADALLLQLQIPESLAGVIERQATRLGTELQALLEAASICGVEFRAQTLADAMHRELNWVTAQCDLLVRRQQWLRALEIEVGVGGSIEARYAFTHALYRQVLYERTGAAARAQLHRRIAVSLERARASGVAVTAAELASHYEFGRDPMSALRHYADAAQSALRHLAPVEAMVLTAHALELLPRCPEGHARDELEMELLGPRAVAAAQLLGTTSLESRAAFERIDALSESMPEKSKRALDVELGWTFQARGEYDKARALAERKVALAERRADRVMFVSACNLMGATLFFQGDLNAARRWLEQGLEAFAQVADQVAQVPFVMDPCVSLRARLARVLSHQGRVDLARSHSDAALARASSLEQPYGLIYASVQAGLLAIRVGDAPRVLELGDAVQRIVDDHAMVEGEGRVRKPHAGAGGFRYSPIMVVEGEAYARWLRGWALAHMGQPDTGLSLIVEGHDSHLRHGRIGVGCAVVLGYAAEALTLAARWTEARTRLDEALALAKRIGERIYVPDLLLLQARLALGCGEHEAARRALAEALREAREQSAWWLELTALLALCEMRRGASDHLEALADARTRIEEGLDTPLMMAAAAVLRSAGQHMRRT